MQTPDTEKSPNKQTHQKHQNLRTSSCSSFGPLRFTRRCDGEALSGAALRPTQRTQPRRRPLATLATLPLKVRVDFFGTVTEAVFQNCAVQTSRGKPTSLKPTRRPRAVLAFPHHFPHRVRRKSSPSVEPLEVVPEQHSKNQRAIAVLGRLDVFVLEGTQRRCGVVGPVTPGASGQTILPYETMQNRTNTLLSKSNLHCDRNITKQSFDHAYTHTNTTARTSTSDIS